MVYRSLRLLLREAPRSAIALQHSTRPHPHTGDYMKEDVCLPSEDVE
jgi:hypothetical protein